MGSAKLDADVIAREWRQERAKGASQQAKAESRTAINALRVWWGNLKRIARVALRGKKQLLEKLGITAR